MALARGRDGDSRRALAGSIRFGRLGDVMLAPVLAAGLLFAAAPAFAQGGGCTRADLQAATDNYLAAQAAGDATKMHMSLWLDYTEQMQEASFDTGLLSMPLKIDFHRSVLDTTNCTSFTESVVTDPAHPYVFGTLVSDRGGEVGAVSVLINDHTDGWLFNPANTLKYSKAENWSEIPPAERDSRDTLIAAANAYLDLFNDKNVQVPWGHPCERLEGGLYTGKGAPGVSLPDDSCDVGVPTGVKIVNRTYVVDPTIGAVTVLSNFGKDALPDAHTFRVEKGKIRYVHTITVCKTFNCGFKLPAQLQASAGG